jgi:hypothetical protein
MPRSTVVQPDLPVFPEGRSPVQAPISDRGRAFVRLFVVLQTMQSSRVGVTLDQLAAETGATTRTIRRDLEVLQEVGIPLVDEAREADDMAAAACGKQSRARRFWRVMGRELSDLRPAAMGGAR